MINQVTAQRGKKISGAAADGTVTYTNNLMNGHLDELPSSLYLEEGAIEVNDLIQFTIRKSCG
jgi:hypothetical protein